MTDVPTLTSRCATELLKSGDVSVGFIDLVQETHGWEKSVLLWWWH